MSQGVDLSHLLAGANSAQNAQSAQQSIGAKPNAEVLNKLVFDATDQNFEAVVELSNTVPVIIDLWAEWCQPCKTLGPILEKVTLAYAGKIVLAKVDVDSNPGLARAFNAQSIPTVVALVAGQPVPLFQGALPEDKIKEYYEQLLELAAKHGVTGSLTVTEAADEPAEPVEPEEKVNPLHEAGLDALEAGDYNLAITEYQKIVTNHPLDDLAKVQLSRARLLQRLDGVSAAEVRENAAANINDIDAQLLAADLDISGGHVEDAFLRVLDLFSVVEADDKTRVREHLLEFFEIVGHSDDRVGADSYQAS